VDKYFIADTYNSVIRQVDTTGTITTVAGNNSIGGTFAGDGGVATAAGLNQPLSVFVDPSGNLIIPDTSNNAIRMVNMQGHNISPFGGGPYLSGNTFIAPGHIDTIAGTGTLGYTGDFGPAVAATLGIPVAVALDSSGNLFIAENHNCVVRRVDATTGIITTFAGVGVESNYQGDGHPAFYTVTSVDDAVGFLTTYHGSFPDGAGNALAGLLVNIQGFSNPVNNIPNGYSTTAVTINSSTTTTITINGSNGVAETTPARANVSMMNAQGIAINAADDIYVADTITNAVIRKIAAGTNIVSTVAGTAGSYGYTTGLLATSAMLSSPKSIKLDSAGNIYIPDPNNSVVQVVNMQGTMQTLFNVSVPAGYLVTVAGNNTGGYSGDGGQATSAELQGPYGVAISGAGNMYIAEEYNSVIRMVTPGGVINTVAGIYNTFSYGGDGGPATSANLNSPADVATPNAPMFNITGTISGPGGSGATVNWSGSSSGSTTANGSGNYTISVANGSYTVTPSPVSYQFSPTSRNVAVSGAGVSGVNFASSPTLSISPSSLLFAATGSQVTPGQAVSASSSASAINFTVTSDSPWLLATPIIGVTPASLTITIDVTALALDFAFGISIRSDAPYPNRMQFKLGDTGQTFTGTLSVSGTFEEGSPPSPVAVFNSPQTATVLLVVRNPAALQMIAFGPLTQSGPLANFDPRRDLAIYADGELLTVQSFSYDTFNNRYLLYMNTAFNLTGTVQANHHVPSPAFISGPGIFPAGASNSGAAAGTPSPLPTVTDYTSFSSGFFKFSPQLLIMASDQFLLFGVDTGGQNHWEVLADDVDTIVYSTDSHIGGNQGNEGESVDTDGYIYNGSQQPSRSSRINPYAFINFGGWGPYGAGNLSTTVDTGGRKYVLFNSAAGANGYLVGCFTRQGDSSPWVFQGMVYSLAVANQSNGGNNCAIISRPPDGRLYMLAADSTGNWWLTSAPLPLNGGSGTPIDPDISVQLTHHADAAQPAVSASFVTGGMVYSIADDAVVVLMTDGSFRKWTSIGSANTITSYSPVTAANVIISDSIRLMYECPGVPNKSFGLAHNDDTFFAAYVSGGHETLAVIDVATMALTTFTDLTAVGFPAAINTWFSTGVTSVFVGIQGVGYDDSRSELFIWPLYGNNGNDGGTHVESLKPFPLTPPIYASTTSFTSPPTSSTFGDSVTFNVNVSSTTTPTGSVVFSDTGVPLATVALNGSGNASYTTSILGYGLHEIRADYQGDSTHATSFSTVPFTVYSTAFSVGGFSIQGTFSTVGDTNLPPAVVLIAIPSSTGMGAPVTLFWDTLNVAQIDITGNVGSPPFTTNLISTSGSGSYTVSGGFASTTILTLSAFDSFGNPILVGGVPLTAAATVTIV
jgi:hypothetical protein